MSYYNLVLTESSGIFGYINYLVEKDRDYIVQTLVNGKQDPFLSLRSKRLANVDPLLRPL